MPLLPRRSLLGHSSHLRHRGFSISGAAALVSNLRNIPALQAAGCVMSWRFLLAQPGQLVNPPVTRPSSDTNAPRLTLSKACRGARSCAGVVT